MLVLWNSRTSIPPLGGICTSSVDLWLLYILTSSYLLLVHQCCKFNRENSLMESQPNKISAGISRVENNNDMKETGEKEIDDSTEIVHFIFLMEKNHGMSLLFIFVIG